MPTAITTQQSNGQQKLTAAQRAALFSAATRQHFQMIGTESVSGGAQSVSFRVPKARILQGLRVLVTMELNEEPDLKDKFAPYEVLRRISLDLNNGFAPITASGREVSLMNTLQPRGEMVLAGYSTDRYETLCTVDGEKIEFMLDLPLSLNYRDVTGFILAQNAETSIDLVIDVDNASVLGDGIEYESMKISVMSTSYSVPARSDWFPDLSILRILDSRKETFTAGQAYVKLPTGMIYRKMILMFTDADGNPMKIEDINSNIEIVLNTADIPYSISPKMLRKLNLMQSGVTMPEGVYFFSFDWQGIIGMGGSRDYIDAERISELAIRFNAACPGKLTVVSEKLSRLIAG